MAFSFLPKLILESVTEITPDFLMKRGIRLLMLDFDNTIVPYTTNEPTSEIAAWLQTMQGSDIGICVVSNSKRGRVRDFCEKWEIPCVTHAKKPFSRGIRQCLTKFGLPEKACALAGDQIFTDTLGANAAGLQSILVRPIHLHNFWLKLRHVLEQPFIFGKKQEDHTVKNLEKYLSLLDGEMDGLLLTSRYSRHYGAEFDIAEGVALVSRKGCRYFTDSRYIESAENNIKGFEVRMVDREHSYHALLNEAIADFGLKNLGFEESYLTVSEFRGYEKKLNAALTPCQEKINSFRAVKEPHEIDLMKKAQEITDKAFSQVLTVIRAGMTEKELCAELIYALYKNGAEGLSFDPIVVSGPNTSLPHGVPGDRRLQNGDFITMDFGILYGGYCSDMTRTVALGYATEEMKKVYHTVLEAQRAGIAATRAGVTGREVDAAARKVITDAGYGDYFGHGYGHSLGLEIHEAPNCNPGGDKVMEAGCVCSAEPGIYLPGKFGVRIEDVVIFREGGCLDITKSPKELLVLQEKNS